MRRPEFQGLLSAPTGTSQVRIQSGSTCLAALTSHWPWGHCGHLYFLSSGLEALGGALSSAIKVYVLPKAKITDRSRWWGNSVSERTCAEWSKSLWNWSLHLTAEIQSGSLKRTQRAFRTEGACATPGSSHGLGVLP